MLARVLVVVPMALLAVAACGNDDTHIYEDELLPALRESGHRIDVVREREYPDETLAIVARATTKRGARLRFAVAIGASDDRSFHARRLVSPPRRGFHDGNSPCSGPTPATGTRGAGRRGSPRTSRTGC